MSIRNSICERWNSEVIWADPNSLLPQVQYSPRTWDPSRSFTGLTGRYGPPIKIAEMFYSENGVPIEEDIGYNYAGRKQLQVAGRSEEHTSELQSLMRISYAVFCLKKKKTAITQKTKRTTEQKRTII